MDLEALIPAHLAAQLVGVSRQLINKWRRRKVNPLLPADHDRQGRPLYRAGDVIDIERETRRSPHSSRGGRPPPAEPAPMDIVTARITWAPAVDAAA